MGLLTLTAFQLSPSVQPRAFVVMGTLALSDVDDDLLYQMLIAFRSGHRLSGMTRTGEKVPSASGIGDCDLYSHPTNPGRRSRGESKHALIISPVSHRLG